MDCEKRSRWLTLFEVTSVSVLLLVHLWCIQRWLHSRIAVISIPVLIGMIMVAAFARRRESLRSAGVEPRQLTSGWRSMIAFTAIGFVALVISGLIWGHLSVSKADLKWASEYVPCLIGQQLALQVFLNNRLYMLGTGLSESKRLWLAVFASAFIFALLHFPNPWLVLSVVPAAIFWTWHFRIHENLAAAIAGHLILGVSAMLTLGNGPLIRLSVGWPAWVKMMGY